MSKSTAEIPYGLYWSTPFAKWQGSLSHLHSVEFAAWTASRELSARGIDPAIFDFGVLGITVPQKHSFYGLPWLSGLVGASHFGGPTVMQACATGVRSILTAAQEINLGLATAALAVCCDKTSNGPHIYYPSPSGSGGYGESENWTLDNFNCDPLGKHPMLRTAENVAAKYGFTTEQQHEVTLLRQEQYQEAKADNYAFMKRYITLPFEVPDARYRKTVTQLNGDEGINQSTKEGLAGLRPLIENGTITFGGQTHPADGNAAIIIANSEQARELSSKPEIAIRLEGFGMARVELAHMPEASIPAAQKALDNAGINIKELKAIKTHNPFAANDLIFSKKLGIKLDEMNNFGCSLIWGHPQAPMGTRSIIELIEELEILGGGYGLFSGCAAGDTAMAVVIKLESR